MHNDRGLDIPRLDFEDYRQIIMSSLRESNIYLCNVPSVSLQGENEKTSL